MRLEVGVNTDERTAEYHYRSAYTYVVVLCTEIRVSCDVNELCRGGSSDPVLYLLDVEGIS